MRRVKRTSSVGERRRAMSRCEVNISEQAATSRRTTVARLAIEGRPSGDAAAVEAMLFDALSRQWPSDMRAKFLLLPGGALTAPWPARWAGRVGWASRPKDVAVLIAEATTTVPSLLSRRVLSAAKDKVGSVAFGIDLFGGPSGATAELIALAHVATGQLGQLVVTGKSLPYSDQRNLVRFSNLSSHFTRLDGERVMLLGCHDLNLFSRRARSRQVEGGLLSEVRWKMDREVERFRPTVVLQLPHGTDTATTWTASWNALREQAPTIRVWASGIAFFNPDPRHRPRSTLQKVLARTRGPDAGLDFVYRTPRSSLRSSSS